MATLTQTAPRKLHHQITSPKMLQKAASAMCAYINYQYGSGLLNGREAERLSNEVSRLTVNISWPNCNCPDCEASYARN